MSSSVARSPRASRATSAYEEFVALGTFSFRRRDNVERVADVVKVN
jgi:hypothetical protein